MFSSIRAMAASKPSRGAVVKEPIVTRTCIGNPQAVEVLQRLRRVQALPGSAQRGVRPVWTLTWAVP